MIKKSYSKTGKICRVTFRLSASEAQADSVAVVGDFNGWDPELNPLTQRKNGSFSTTVSLDSGQKCRFRYLAGGERWLNDEQVDSLVPNRFGGQDGLLEL